MAGPRLLLLVDDLARFARERYFAKPMLPHWRAAGWEVVVAEAGAALPDADVALVHVDLTVLPAALLESLSRYPRVVNGRCVDISKRRVSAQLVAPGDGYAGPVIVKTNANCGGVSERRLRYPPTPAGQWRRLRDRLRPWPVSGRLNSKRYPVFDSPASVPAAAWSNPDLVVERFLAEREGEFYALRQWVFLGERDLHRRSLARHPVIKSGQAERIEVLGEVPAELRARRQALGFDYGKFDYVLHEGRAVLLDANRTPTHGAQLGAAGAGLAAGLAAGLEAWR